MSVSPARTVAGASQSVESMKPGVFEARLLHERPAQPAANLSVRAEPAGDKFQEFIDHQLSCGPMTTRRY